jgi:hypothetical protein
MLTPDPHSTGAPANCPESPDDQTKAEAIPKKLSLTEMFSRETAPKAIAPG